MSSVVPSKLQDRVLSAFREGRNVVVEAVAGAGKTTVFLLLARDFADALCTSCLNIQSWPRSPADAARCWDRN